MNIFEVVNNVVEFSPQALLLKPFKAIWDKDKTKDKAKALKELSLIYFMCDDRSDYMYIMDLDERMNQIKSDLGFANNWKKQAYIETAMEFYINRSVTVYTKMLESSRGIVHKISAFNDTVNLNERDKHGKYLNNRKEILSSIKDVYNALESLDKIENLIVKQKELKSQTGNRETGLFDTNDGI
jgi:hypothetical protein